MADKEEILDRLEKLEKKLEELEKKLKFERKKEIFNLSEMEENILSYLKDGEQYTSKVLADKIGKDRTTVSAYLKSLYEKGYLNRKVKIVDVSSSRKIRQWKYLKSKQKK